MQSTAFFETKVSITPKDLNTLISKPMDELLLEKVTAKLENKCSSHGFVLPGTIKLVSRSVGYFEAARFTGDAVYYVKAEGQVIYPTDGYEVVGEVIRKNKMGLYVVHRNAIRIQVPRDLHIGSEEYESVEIGDRVKVILRRSKFQVNDEFILATGEFVERVGAKEGEAAEEEAAEEEATEEAAEEEAAEEGEEEEAAEEGEEETGAEAESETA